MKKFPFTPSGVADFQKQLYLQQDTALVKEALAVASDFLSWAGCHFELDVYLLEQLRFLPETFRLQLGWCLATSFLGRTSISLGHYETETEEGLSFNMAFAASSDSPGEAEIRQSRLVIHFRSDKK